MAYLYDNVSLNTSPFLITEFKHEESAERDVLLYPLARERGAIVVDAPFKSKRIVITGKIVGDDLASFENNVDSFKELVSREGKTLELSYGNGSRRYKSCYANRIFVDRKFWQLNYAPYELEFIAPYGIAEDASQTNTSQSGITTATKTGTETVGGSAFPTPQIKFTFSGTITGLTTLSFLLNGDKITLSQTIATGDIVIFDCENKKVTVNGVEKDYTGMFPTFVVGTNSWQVDCNGSARTYKIEIIYNKKYI